MKNIEEKPFTFISAVGILLKGFLASMVIGIIYILADMVIYHTKPKSFGHSDSYLIMILVSIICMNFLITYIGIKRINIKKLDFNPINTKIWIPSILILLAMGTILGETTFLLNLPDWAKIDKYPTYLILIGGLIIAPVFEELIYRGIILKGFLKTYDTQKAILFSAILFSLVHFNPAQIPATFAIGIFFGWIFVKTNSLWPTIILHFINNCIALLPRIFPKLKNTFLGSNSILETMPNQFLYLGLMMLILTIGFVAFGYLSTIIQKQNTLTVKN